MSLRQPGEGWTELARRLHLENREQTKAGLARESGSDHLDNKIENFVSIGFKPFSVLAYHNQFFDQVEEKTRNGMYSVNGILPHIPSSGIFGVIDSCRCAEPMKSGTQRWLTRNIPASQLGRSSRSVLPFG